MHQSWRDLLFLHWRCEPGDLQQKLPAGLTIDTHGGAAWIGIVAFLMRNIRPAWAPAVPYISNFLELNLRTYAVDESGVRGVWFFSLNANRWVAVQLARRAYRLPYHWCAMSAHTAHGGMIDYRCRRFGTDGKRTCRYRYRANGRPRAATVGTLEHFLVERYVLFTRLPDGGVAAARVHHVPYPIQEVEVEHYDENLLLIDGLSPVGRPFDHACFSAGVDVDVYPLKRQASGTTSP